MDANIYHFKVGEFDCTIVNDGTYSYPQPGKLLFDDVPLDRLAAALERYDIDLDAWDVYVSPYPSLVIDTGEQRVLVDTGMGPLVPTTGNLRRNLMAAGFRPDEIDIVILTHAHPDHIGGNLDEEGKPAFPNARWVMGRSEWEFWTGDPDLSALRDDHFIPMMLASAGANLPPIEPLLDFVEAGELVAEVDGAPVEARLRGMMRGLKLSGVRVGRGHKVGDVDPRRDRTLLTAMTDKAQAVGRGVVQAALEAGLLPAASTGEDPTCT